MAYTREMLTKEQYTTGEVAKIFGVSPLTIQNWDNKGLIQFSRTPTNRRIVHKEDLISFLKQKNMFYENEKALKRDVIYARVSSGNQQKQGDLDRQVDFILSNSSNLSNVLILKEVGSGLNSKRKKLTQLLDMVMNNEVNRIFITYKERLTRFGFEYIENICNKMNVEIVIMKNTLEKKSIEQELTEDIMSLLASFSGRLYGMRSHKNKKGKESGRKQN